MNSEKQEHIRNWKRSGRTKAEYCREHGIKYMTFMNWVKKEAVSESAAGWQEIGIIEEKKECSERMFFSVRILEGWNIELIFRFRNDIP
ncbi:MAG TPA: hypothetical protein PLJ29_02065 [Leptospiraceae bacterium]|nr:hypothetical protein [Rhodocyclaceae bacterium]HNI25115.1 hypothetical protein [Leptospiraceae bacterium]